MLSVHRRPALAALPCSLIAGPRSATACWAARSLATWRTGRPRSRRARSVLTAAGARASAASRPGDRRQLAGRVADLQDAQVHIGREPAVELGLPPAGVARRTAVLKSRKPVRPASSACTRGRRRRTRPRYGSPTTSANGSCPRPASVRPSGSAIIITPAQCPGQAGSAAGLQVSVRQDFGPQERDHRPGSGRGLEPFEVGRYGLWGPASATSHHLRMKPNFAHRSVAGTGSAAESADVRAEYERITPSSREYRACCCPGRPIVRVVMPPSGLVPGPLTYCCAAITTACPGRPSQRPAPPSRSFPDGRLMWPQRFSPSRRQPLSRPARGHDAYEQITRCHLCDGQRGCHPGLKLFTRTGPQCRWRTWPGRSSCGLSAWG